MISIDDYLYFVDEALDGMVGIVTDLGDELANRRPDVPDTNSPYVLLHHCLGVMEYAPEYADLPVGRTQGGVLIHVYEELAQHRGQMEGCRDVLLAPWARLA